MNMVRKLKSADERRVEIIKGARELFLAKDYVNATMQDLIEKLIIAKGTIYHYFPSKQSLLEAVVEDIVDEELKKKEELLKCRSVRSLSAIEKISLLIKQNDAVRDIEPLISRFNNNENSEMYCKQLGSYITRLAPLYAAIIKDGCDEGIFKTDYPLECAEFLLAGVQFLTDPGFYAWNKKQLDRRIKALPSLIEIQLGSPAGTFGFLNNKKL
jgi:AcrR family transcriptional regulator